MDSTTGKIDSTLTQTASAEIAPAQIAVRVRAGSKIKRRINPISNTNNKICRPWWSGRPTAKALKIPGWVTKRNANMQRHNLGNSGAAAQTSAIAAAI